VLIETETSNAIIQAYISKTAEHSRQLLLLHLVCFSNFVK